MINMVAFKAPSQSRSGSALPSFRKLYDLLGDCVSGRGDGPSACWRATRAISKATPRRRAVSASNPGLKVASDRHG